MTKLVPWLVFSLGPLLLISPLTQHLRGCSFCLQIYSFRLISNGEFPNFSSCICPCLSCPLEFKYLFFVILNLNYPSKSLEIHHFSLFTSTLSIIFFEYIDYNISLSLTKGWLNDCWKHSPTSDVFKKLTWWNVLKPQALPYLLEINMGWLI